MAARLATAGAWLLVLSVLAGCEALDRQTDRDVVAVIRARQQAALGAAGPAELEVSDGQTRADRTVRARNPRPASDDVPADFTIAASQPATAPAMPTSAPSLVATQPVPGRGRPFTLTDALAYAQLHRREYQTAKEDLYLAALRLTLERHLWTPIFSSELKTAYRNYGEAQDFDNAMSFIANLGVAQRLPYGGEFTARAIASLVRDLSHTITASEGSEIQLGLRVPLLRGAGHVAQEDLIQLERELTYAVRTFERFRRQQLVTVAQRYFELLRLKQQVADSERSLERAIMDHEFAKGIENIPERGGSPLNTQRAELRMLDAENTVQTSRETLRTTIDSFKVLIGMPLEEPLAREDLEDIQKVEARIAAGDYVLLAPPPATRDEERATVVAVERRLDLLTLRDRIDDARRGVEISRNALLPDLNWNSTLTFDTDPNHYNVGAHHFERADWRTEVALELPLERTAERNALRRSMIDVRAAQRTLEDQGERVRVEVRSIVNRLRLQERVVEIQQRSVEVAERQAEYAQLRFEEGKIDNRDKVQAEQDLLTAQNRLNQAKTDRWNLLLQFRLATETLRVEEDGTQTPDPDMP